LQGAEEPTIEALCDFFARSLLLPRVKFVSRVESLNSSLERDLPPLHLIPQLAKEFAVAPQAVARRMVFDFSSSHWAVLSARRNVASHLGPWHTVWFAASARLFDGTPKGWRIPLDSHGRAVPSAFVPNLQSGETKFAMIDGRVHEAAMPQDTIDCRVPLSKRSALPFKPALLAHCETDADLFGVPTELMFLALRD